MGVDSKGNSLKQPMHPFHLAYGIGLKGSVARVRNKTPKHTKSLTGPSGRTLSSKFSTTGESDIGDIAEWPAVPSVTNLYARLLQKPSIIDDIGPVKHIFKAPLNLPESEEIVIKSNKFDEAPWCCAVKQSINVKNVFIRTSEFEQTILGGHSNPDTNFLTYELVANLREERSLFNHFL